MTVRAQHRRRVASGHLTLQMSLVWVATVVGVVAAAHASDDLVWVLLVMATSFGASCVVLLSGQRDTVPTDERQARVHISNAQRDVRHLYAGGSTGQMVSAGVWLVAAALGTWASAGAGIVALLVGGTLIFPLTSAVLWLAGGPVSLPRGHPMAPLAMQIAFTVPLGLLVALGATASRQDWFFPASMVIVGAHYLPFVFLYGMASYAVLSATLVTGGLTLALWLPAPFSTGGWVTGGILALAAVLLRSTAEDPGPVTAPDRRDDRAHHRPRAVTGPRPRPGP